MLHDLTITSVELRVSYVVVKIFTESSPVRGYAEISGYIIVELPHDWRGLPYSAKHTVNMLCFAWLLSAEGVCGRPLRLQWDLFQ